MKNLIIYDLDGTLIDSRQDIADAVNGMLAELGAGPLSMEAVSSFVGSGVQNLIKKTWQTLGVSAPPLERSIKLFRKRYGERLLDKTRLYPGVKEVLECFKNCRQAVITNKPEAFSVRILEGLGIAPYFFQVVGGDSGFPKKPAPDGVLEIIRKAAVSSEDTLLVGDSEIDITAGRNAGIPIVAVTYGFGTRLEIEKAKPDYIIEDLKDLKKCPLLQNSSKSKP